MIESLSASGIEPTGEPGISVVIPFYRAEKFFGAALDSVARQTLPVLEVLVVVDGKNAVQDGYFEGFSHAGLRVEYLDENSGAGAARNLGLKLASGEFIAFLDADDLWLAEKLKRQLRFMNENPGCEGCHTGVAVFDAADNTVRSFTEKPPRLTLADLFDEGSQIVPSSFLIRREALLAVGGFDESYRTSEDFELALRLVQNGTEIGFVPEPLTRLRRADHGNISSNGLLLLRHHVRIALQYRDSLRHCGGAGAFTRFVGHYLYADGTRVRGLLGLLLRVLGRCTVWVGARLRSSSS